MDVAATFPWWLNLAFAAVSYLAIRFITPVLPASSPIIRMFLHAAPALAPIAALLFILAAILSAYKQWEGRQLLRTSPSIDAIRRLDWLDFEKLVAAACQRQGFTVKHTGGRVPDGGVDVVLTKDGKTYLVQCKHWKAYKVSVQPVRELAGVISAEKAAGGFFVTTGVFTDAAKVFGKQAGLVLIAGNELVEMLDVAEGNPHGELAPTSDPICPQCGSPMKRRTATKGVHRGEPFWGCSRFPACRGMVADYG